MHSADCHLGDCNISDGTGIKEKFYRDWGTQMKA